MNGDEESGYDEVIYPVDFKVNGQLVDDVGLYPSIPIRPPYQHVLIFSLEGHPQHRCQTASSRLPSYCRLRCESTRLSEVHPIVEQSDIHSHAILAPS